MPPSTAGGDACRYYGGASGQMRLPLVHAAEAALPQTDKLVMSFHELHDRGSGTRKRADAHHKLATALPESI